MRLLNFVNSDLTQVGPPELLIEFRYCPLFECRPLPDTSLHLLAGFPVNSDGLRRRLTIPTFHDAQDHRQI